MCPSRSLEYISIAGKGFGKGYAKLLPSSVEPLLRYCKLMHTKHMKIDCCSVADSIIWQDYLAQSLKTKHDYKPNVDVPYTLPSLQEFLSGIETLKLHVSGRERSVQAEKVEAVSYVILHNIVTSNQPSLKHLIISGISNASSWVLAGVTKLLCKSTGEQATAPYLLESISLLPCDRVFVNGRFVEHLFSSVASEIASNLNVIVSFQMHNLKSVAVHCLGFCHEHMPSRCFGSQHRVNTPEYRQLLSSLVAFLKQPQMQSLDIDKCPSPEAYQLIEDFLCTPTSIEQQLRIQVQEEELAGGPLMPPISQPIPESSARFKHLCMDVSSSHRSVAWLLNLPELKANSLRFSAQYLPLGSPDIVVQVKHITFYCSVHLSKPTILPDHLERFIITNQALTTLEMIIDTPFGPSHPRCLDIYPALNHCLTNLCRQGKTLEELCMNVFSFKEHNPTEFFTTVRDLSQQCGTTLVLSGHVLFSEEQLNSLLPALSKEFQEKKIKKIVFKNNNLRKSDSYVQMCLNKLRLVADEVRFS